MLTSIKRYLKVGFLSYSSSKGIFGIALKPNITNTESSLKQASIMKWVKGIF